jgi:hypothetical protein
MNLKRRDAVSTLAIHSQRLAGLETFSGLRALWSLIWSRAVTRRARTLDAQ